MRLVAVDVGNTSTAVGLWSDGRVSRVSHLDGPAEAACAAIGKLAAAGNVDGIAYASVVPAKDSAFRRCARSLGLRLIKVSHRCFPVAGVRLDYPKAETIGADRLADAAGAVSRYGAPVLIMDFGTALTAAVVTRDRVWRGGVIAPGFPLMRDYLFERTANLPKMEIGGGRLPKIGRSTVDAMRIGARVGYRGMVREIVAEMQRNFRCDFKLVATGGFAKWVLSGLDLPFTVDPTLTLYGTGLICSQKI